MNKYYSVKSINSDIKLNFVIMPRKWAIKYALNTQYGRNKENGEKARH